MYCALTHGAFLSVSDADIVYKRSLFWVGRVSALQRLFLMVRIVRPERLVAGNTGVGRRMSTDDVCQLMQAVAQPAPSVNGEASGQVAIDQ